MTLKRKILLGAAVVLAGIQFIRPEKNLGVAEGPDSIVAKHDVPPPVRTLLARACYDCHSNATHYPWYAEVQPVGWWLADHVKDGKQHVNFSEFGKYTPKRAARALDESVDELIGHRMPLPSYTWMHRDAVLTDAEIKTLSDWADALHDEIAP